MSQPHTRKYAAFISYSHSDEKIAKWLQRKLESYKLPIEIQNEFDNSRYLRPIFRDRSDLNGGILTEELHSHLENSKFLILLCSPKSAQSAWVSKEVQTFIEWGRLQYIIPFVVDGEINSNNENECLPLYLRQYVAQYPDRELLCIDIRESGKEQAYIRVVSRILGLEFDELWHRHLRDKQRKRIALVSSILVIGILFYWFCTPISLKVSISDTPSQLPAMKNANIKIGNISYNINNADTTILRILPGYWRLRHTAISFNATYYYPIDTMISIGCMPKQNLHLDVYRDKTFAIFAGEIIDEEYQPIDSVKIMIEGVEMGVSDNNGHFYIELPLNEQDTHKSIQIFKSGYKTLCREDECPGRNIIYKLSKVQ